MSRKKKNRREKRKRGRPSKPGLPPVPPGVEIRMTPPGGEKMSEVLEEFIEPWSWTTVEQLKMLLSVAVIAWNAALVPSNKREALFGELLAKLPPEEAVPMKAVLDEMIQRKLAYFAGNRRFIFSFEVTMQSQGPYIMVASTPTSI